MNLEENLTKVVEVFDAIMGSGKSTNILKWCDENTDNRFIYVTPLLSESEDRVVNACSVAKFIAPQATPTLSKGEHLLDLLKCGENVSITHRMYSLLKSEHLTHIKEKGYTLILDEEVNFIEPLSGGYKDVDFHYLSKLNQLEIKEDGRVDWVGDDGVMKDTKYTKLANMCNLGMVYQSKRKESWFVTQLPMSLIHCAKRVILLTYLFEGSILDSFLSMKGISTVPFKEVGVRNVDKQRIRDLIEFVGDRQVKEWSGESMSSTWYKDVSQAKLTKLGKSIRSIGDSLKVRNPDLLWCSPSDVARPKTKNARKLAPVGFGAGDGKGVSEDDIAVGCYLPCTSRATNAYRDRTVMIHCYNRFPHVSVTSFLQDYGATVDRDKFALAEFLQWLWRSAIRDDKPIKVCILPRRMRKLFQDWLAED